jgi:large subunit ribosomal protein L21
MHSKSHSKAYAIIKTGGKQYRVAQDDIIEVELLDAEPGAQVEFQEVLMFKDDAHTKFGEPSLAGFIVKGELVGTVSGPKLMSIKYKPSHHQYRKFGHRQHYSRVKITEIKRIKEANHGT